MDGHVWVEVVLPTLPGRWSWDGQATACGVEKTGLAPPGWSPVQRTARTEKVHAEQLKKSGGCGVYPMNAWLQVEGLGLVTTPLLSRADPTVETNSGSQMSMKPGEEETAG